jgi:dynein heavy chain, axonemal
MHCAGNWQHWSDLVPHWAYPKQNEKPKFAQLTIPTLDSTRYDALLTLVASVNKSSLLVGGPGTAKTTVVNMFMSKFPVEEVASKVITFSSLTTPSIFQKTIEASVEKRQGRTFGPPGGKKMIVFIDDISMPFINNWGDQVGASRCLQNSA